jgi:glycosyltransferase involved in cell wall biosynthesis
MQGLTVVIPCRGATKTLQACITTLVNQWPPDLNGEIIIVDDGSGDSYQYLLSDQIIPMRLVRMPKQSGPGACRNAGVLATETAWVVFVDDDCLFPWGWLQQVLARTAPDQPPRLLGGKVRARRPRNWWSQAMEDFVLNPTWQNDHWSIITANAVVHRDVWTAVGGFDAEYRFAGGEDWDFSHRVARSGFTVDYDPTLWCFHENSTTPGPYFERAVRYGRAHARWKISQETQGDRPVARARLTKRSIAVIGRKGRFLVRRYSALHASGASPSRALRSSVLFGMFVAVFDVAAVREGRSLQRNR